MLIHGSCHCGNMSFELDWKSDPVEIPARACGCTFCIRHGNVWTSSPGCTLIVSIKDGTEVTQYSFGTGTARFHICRICGVVPVATSEIEGRLYAVVNINTFIEDMSHLLHHASVSFDGENIDARLARRKRGWIAEVRIQNTIGKPIVE